VNPDRLEPLETPVFTIPDDHLDYIAWEKSRVNNTSTRLSAPVGKSQTDGPSLHFSHQDPGYAAMAIVLSMGLRIRVWRWQIGNLGDAVL